MKYKVYRCPIKDEGLMPKPTNPIGYLTGPEKPKWPFLGPKIQFCCHSRV